MLCKKIVLLFQKILECIIHENLKGKKSDSLTNLAVEW